MATNVENYRRKLATELDGKDPRSSGVGAGSAVLVFGGEGVITVQIHPTRVAVVAGGQSLEALPTVLVRSSLGDWLAYCESPNPQTAQKIEVFGDTTQLDALGKLVDSKRNGVAARFFGHS